MFSVKLVDFLGESLLVLSVCVILLLVGNKFVVIGKLLGRCVDMLVVFCWFGVGVLKLVLKDDLKFILLLNW